MQAGDTVSRKLRCDHDPSGFLIDGSYRVAQGKSVYKMTWGRL
jgi:hypothetical protein